MAKSRAELLQFAKRDHVEVDGVRLQSLTELEISELETLWGKRYRETEDIDLVMRRELLVRCIVDDAGHRLFDDTEVDLLGQWPSRVVVKLYASCRDLCGMNDSRAKAVDDAEKKSEEVPD